jgi:ribonuclease H2 subunit B
LNEFLSSNTSSSFLGTTYLPGRGSSKDSDASSLGGGNAAAAAKKRKLESKGSRGVEALKKVNTKGMKSLAEMFGKQPPAKKAAGTTSTSTRAAAAKGKKK